MYINVGDNLFLPEGDDYSKTDFDQKIEEVELQGTAILQQLRKQQEMEKTIKTTIPTSTVPKKQVNSKENQGKKLTYKEILDSVVASK